MMNKKTLLKVGKAFANLLWILMFSSFIVGSFLLGFTKEAWLSNFVEMGVNCSGIDYYYTNTSFVSDVNYFLDDVGYEENVNIVTPIEMRDGNKGDCKSLSHGIMCLSKLYNITCRYYAMSIYDPTTNESVLKSYGGHLGIYCKVNDVWLKMY